MKQEVWRRDQGCCSYVDPHSGRRCGSRFLLQIDHVVPVTHGGGAEPGNLCLLYAPPITVTAMRRARPEAKWCAVRRGSRPRDGNASYPKPVLDSIAAQRFCAPVGPVPAVQGSESWTAGANGRTRNIPVLDIDFAKARRSTVSVRLSLSQYEEEGYLILPEVLRPDEVAAATAEIERLHQVAAADPEAGSFAFEPFTDTRTEQGRPVLRQDRGQRSDLGAVRAHGVQPARAGGGEGRCWGRICCCSAPP